MKEKVKINIINYINWLEYKTFEKKELTKKEALIGLKGYLIALFENGLINISERTEIYEAFLKEVKEINDERKDSRFYNI